MEAHAVTTFVCHHCHADLDASQQFCPKCGTPAGVSDPQGKQRMLDRPWFLVVVVLHLGAFGIPVYWATRYSHRTRIMIIIASIVYTIVAVAIIVWSLRVIINAFA